MSSLAVKVTAAATALAAGSYCVSSASALLARFVSSPPFLWYVAANVIIVWLLSSYRRRGSVEADDGASSSSADDVLSAVDELYPPSDYDGYSSSASGFFSSAEAPVAVASRPRRHKVRDAARPAGRRTERARVTPPPNKPAETRGPDATAVDKKRVVNEVVPATRSSVAAASEGGSKQAARTDGDDDDLSLDSLWQSMVQRRTARPVAVRKSETWGNDELPRLQRAAETAAARRREMRKSASSAGPPPPEPQLGWRTRDVLVRAHDDLLRRAESLIRRHHEQLRLQRQESQQRQAMERHQRGAPALIRV